jgi:hypothetical protein
MLSTRSGLPSCHPSGNAGGAGRSRGSLRELPMTPNPSKSEFVVAHSTIVHELAVSWLRLPRRHRSFSGCNRDFLCMVFGPILKERKRRDSTIVMTTHRLKRIGATSRLNVRLLSPAVILAVESSRLRIGSARMTDWQLIVRHRKANARLNMILVIGVDD